MPASSDHICLYVAFLSRSLKYHSIINYISAVKFLHTFLGYPVEWEKSFSVKATVIGYKRILGAASVQKKPVTIDMLRDIISKCNPHTESGFIACILIGFFAFLRKANLCPESAAKFDRQFHLSRGDFEKADFGLILSVRGSKVIQFRQRVLQVPIVSHSSNSTICPVRAFLNHIECISSAPNALRSNAKTASP